jgi:phenylalanine-4-hydroxylase
MVREFGDKKIYGAGILSSHGETLHCLGSDVKMVPFDVQEIFNTPFRMDVFQDTHFVLQSFDQLLLCLEEIDFLLARQESENRRHVA